MHAATLPPHVVSALRLASPHCSISALHSLGTASSALRPPCANAASLQRRPGARPSAVSASQAGLLSRAEQLELRPRQAAAAPAQQQRAACEGFLRRLEHGGLPPPSEEEYNRLLAGVACAPLDPLSSSSADPALRPAPWLLCWPNQTLARPCNLQSSARAAGWTKRCGCTVLPGRPASACATTPASGSSVSP